MKRGIPFLWDIASRARLPHIIVLGVLPVILISCAYPPKQRGGIEMYPGWYMASQAQGRTLAERPPVKQVTHPPRKGPFPPLKVALPKVEGADYIHEDELCMTCHQTHTQMFREKNAHRTLSCEDCHGPASEHVGTRGQEEGKILNVRRLEPAQRSEFCLRCHETKTDAKSIVPAHAAQWRTSVHAHEGVFCSDCHKVHYELPKGTPTVTPPAEASRPQPLNRVALNAAARQADPHVRRARGAHGRGAARRCRRCAGPPIAWAPTRPRPACAATRARSA